MSASAQGDLSCRELVERVTEYLEGAMDAVERARFEHHLSVCDPCRIYLSQMRAVVRSLGKLGEVGLPPAARDVLLRAFRARRRR